MTDPIGVNLLPASGEWVYDTLPHRVTPVDAGSATCVNLNAAPGGTRTDCSIALDQLQTMYPGLQTVALVVAWFANATDVTQCRIYPTTTLIGGRSEVLVGGTWSDEPWRCSGLTQSASGLIPLSRSGDDAVYGGTPSDPSVVRCLRELKARGLRTVFYPFVLMDAPGLPWRGRIGFAGADVSTAASAAVAAFLGAAQTTQFVADPANLTVGYAGAPDDYTYRRMILHYANLCVLAGGVDLFLVGSELRALEAIRGPAWTNAGGVSASGTAGWDYPFVAGLAQLAADVRGTFDAAGLGRDTTGLHNLIAYSADWSSWMGVQHADANGQWPHLDALWASPAIDLVAFDNYLPLSDWTSGAGGLDAANWSQPAPQTWPPGPATMNGLGLSGTPMLASKPYLKANIEGGAYGSWYYADGANLGCGRDPAGSAQQVSLPTGDRLAQARRPYQPGQELLAPKKLRWWWANRHHAIYDADDGRGWVPQGAPTAWVACSKPITFAEYGFPSVDRATNQPNVFFDPRSSESATPFWSIWDPVAGGGYAPRRDDLIAALGREALLEYWTSDGNNAVSADGVPMIEPQFMCAWNADARPFPAFPKLPTWGDAPNWASGTWIAGKGPIDVPAPADASPVAGPLATFPTLSGQGWTRVFRPAFATRIASHVSGRETRAARDGGADWTVTLTFDVLSIGIAQDIAILTGFYAAQKGAALPFLLVPPPELGLGPGLPCRFATDQLDADEFAAGLATIKALVLHSVKV